MRPMRPDANAAAVANERYHHDDAPARRHAWATAALLWSAAVAGYVIYAFTAAPDACDAASRLMDAFSAKPNPLARLTLTELCDARDRLALVATALIWGFGILVLSALRNLASPSR